MFQEILFATIVYTMVNITIGVWNRKNLNFETFISNRGKSSKTFIMLSIVATIVGGGMFFATGQMGYEAGVAGLSLPISYIFGFILLAKFVPNIRNLVTSNNCYTLYDVVDAKLSHSGKWADYFNFLIMLINLIIYFFLLAGQFLILAVFYKYFITESSNIALLLSVLVIILSTFIYSFFGGVRKDIITDSFQMMCVLIGTIIISFFIFKSGLYNSILNLSPKYLNGTGYGILFPIGVLIFFTPSFLVRYDFWQRIIASKDDKDAKKSLYYAIPLVIIFYFIFIYLGMVARSINPKLVDTNFATIFALNQLLPRWAFVIVVISLYAAIMSSADTFLNISSISLFSIFNKKKINDSKNALSKIRIYTIIVGLLSAIIIILSQNIVNLMVGAFSSLIILVPAMVYILLSNKPSGKIATTNSLIAFLIFVCLFFFLSGFEKYAFVIATFVSVILHAISIPIAQK